MMTAIEPIFIIGAPRSGTSILTWAIGQHPNIQAMPETAWLAVHALGSYNAWGKGSERGKFSHLSNVDYPLDRFMEHMGESADQIINEAFQNRCKNIYGDYKTTQKPVTQNNNNRQSNFHLLRDLDDPKLRWVDGTPANTFYLWGLSKMFPNARFIHNLRIPCEVVRSLGEFENAGGHNVELGVALREWYHHTLQANYFQLAMGKDKVYLLDFKRLSDDPASLMEDIFTFLGEDNCEHSLEIFDKKINSSKVDQTSVITKITQHADYNKSLELYENALNWEMTESQDECLSKVKAQFLDQAKQSMPF